MKRKAEIAAAALAVMFICFTIGYFAGRRSAPSQVSLLAGTVVVTPPVAQPPDRNGYAAALESAPAAKTSETPKTVISQAPATPDAASVATPAVETPAVESVTPTPEQPAAPAVITAAPESHYTENKLLRINLATQKELETLPGIGEVLASRIIEYRQQNGPFTKLSTLKLVKGIGDGRYSAIKDLITVE